MEAAVVLSTCFAPVAVLGASSAPLAELRAAERGLKTAEFDRDLGAFAIPGHRALHLQRGRGGSESASRVRASAPSARTNSRRSRPRE